MDFDEILYGHYAIEGYPKLILFSFLQLVIPTWWMNELLGWEQH
jgi:hypothetical protein